MSSKNRIACFGSSHTEGGLGWAESKDFINSWPGQLHSRLKDTDVLNAGQSSFSIDFWPTKLLNVIDYYKPTHVLMEINIKEKLDFEMSADLTGESCSDNKNYHPPFFLTSLSCCIRFRLKVVSFSCFLIIIFDSNLFVYIYITFKHFIKFPISFFLCGSADSNAFVIALPI